MVIFHSYVSLPEGKAYVKPSKIWPRALNLRCCFFWCGSPRCTRQPGSARSGWDWNLSGLEFVLTIKRSISIDWFKGKITGKSRISWENPWFPVDFPFQLIHWSIVLWMNKSLMASMLTSLSVSLFVACTLRNSWSTQSRFTSWNQTDLETQHSNLIMNHGNPYVSKCIGESLGQSLWKLQWPMACITFLSLEYTFSVCQDSYWKWPLK